MFIEEISTATEYVASLGFDAAKERTHDKLDERKFRTEMTSYIECQRKYDEMCSQAEEFDSQRLVCRAVN